MAKDKQLEDELRSALVEVIDVDVKHGHPLDPNKDKLLSADEEKRVDERGHKVATGLLWSEAKTGLYLLVGVTTLTPKIDKVLIGGAHAIVPKEICGKLRRNLKLTVGVTLGRPKFHCNAWGACLELPSDLGRDHVKQQYIAEWIAETAAEALVEAGVNFQKNPVRTDALGLWVSQAANTSINAVGL